MKTFSSELSHKREIPQAYRSVLAQTPHIWKVKLNISEENKDSWFVQAMKLVSYNVFFYDLNLVSAYTCISLHNITVEANLNSTNYNCDIFASVMCVLS